MIINVIEMLQNCIVIRNAFCSRKSIFREFLKKKTDIMQSTENSNSDFSHLPNVTDTENNYENADSGYVCHFNFDKSESA